MQLLSSVMKRQVRPCYLSRSFRPLSSGLRWRTVPQPFHWFLCVHCTQLLSRAWGLLAVTLEVIYVSLIMNCHWNEPYWAYQHKNAVTGEWACCVSYCHLSPGYLSFLTVVSAVQLNYLMADLQESSCFALVPLLDPFTASATSVKSSFIECFWPLKQYCFSIRFLRFSAAVSPFSLFLCFSEDSTIGDIT